MDYSRPQQESQIAAAAKQIIDMVTEAEARLKSKPKKEAQPEEDVKEVQEVIVEAKFEQNEDGDLVQVAVLEEVKERVVTKPNLENIADEID